MKTFVTLIAMLCIIVVIAAHDSPLAKLRMQNAFAAYDEAVSVSATPDMLQESLSWVTVKWSGVASPTKADFIAVYPQTPYKITETPAKYKFCSDSPSHLKDGSGSVEFRLVNMRSAYTFVLFRGGESDPVAVASSNQVHFANPNEPLQVHLALTNNVRQMQVTWTTYNSSAPEVRWGTASASYTNTTAASTITYTAAQMCGAPATTHGWIEPGLMHTAIMTDLNPSQRYYYIVGDVSHGWSHEFTFLASPPVAPSTSFKFVAYGDMGKAEVDHSLEHWEEYQSLDTVYYTHQEVMQNNHTLVVHIGDIAYAVGYAAQWDAFMAQIQPVAAHVPYMTCIGNHERDYPNSGSLFSGTDSGGECGVPYEHRFRMPRPAEDEPWYSFNFGSVHFVFMSTEHEFHANTKQHLFLREDLSRVDRARTPWVIFSGHRPMYSANPHAEIIREQIEPLLIQYKVDLALWGHDHDYQRFCALKHGACVPKRSDGTEAAPVHLVIGMAGAGFSGKPNRMPDIVRYFNNAEHGYTRIAVTEHSLTVEYLSDTNGALRDSVVLKR